MTNTDTAQDVSEADKAADASVSPAGTDHADRPAEKPEDSASSAPAPGPAEKSAPGSAPQRWWWSVRAVAAVAVAALVVAVTFVALWATDDSADRLAALQSRLDTEAAAEHTASTYALNVSKVDFHDLAGWRAALTHGVSGQLAPKLDAAVDVVGPWLTEMEYTATARLLAAKVAQSDGNSFVVQVFVDMTSKSKQAPDGVAATATYTVTMDRASNWTITDVGGVGAGLPGGASKPAPAPAPEPHGGR